jgi:hypothetical protein
VDHTDDDATRGDVSGTSESETEAEATRRGRASLVAEVERVAADEADLAEMRAIRDQMAGMAPDLSAQDLA